MSEQPVQFRARDKQRKRQRDIGVDDAEHDDKPAPATIVRIDQKKLPTDVRIVMHGSRNR